MNETTDEPRDKVWLPKEARELPVLDIGEDLRREDLYTVIEGTTCRRCSGSGIDPDGEYPCLLCRGKKIEKFIDGNILVCTKHPDKELVNIGIRHVTWEDGMGFDREGYLGVKGCPICRIPAYSVMWG